MNKEDNQAKHLYFKTQLTFGMALVSANLLLSKELMQSLPEQYWNQNLITLGFEMGRAGNKVLMDEYGIRQTFTFGPTYKSVFVPWETVFQIEGTATKARKRWRAYEPEGLHINLEVINGGIPWNEKLPTPPIYGHLTLVRE